MATIAEASLTCSICLRRFRKPRILPCLHSYCEVCLKEYAPSGTKDLLCPLCQEKIQIPGGDVTKFKLDFRLQNQVEEAARYKKDAGLVSDVQVCNCCKDEGEAIGKCGTCKQMLCKFGIKAHENMAGLRNHVVTSVNDGDVLIETAVSKEQIDEQGDNQEFEKEEAPIEKRAILVSNIPRRLRHSAERFRDILTIHFQRRRNGGGDIDDVLYPVEGCPQNAFIIFTDAQTCSTVLKKKHFLDDFQVEVNVEPFPQVFKTVEAEVDTFYWNFVPRLTSKKLIDHLEQKFGKGNLQTAGHVLKKITCTMGELEEVHSAIAKATGLQSSDVGGHSVINSGVFIKDIPYLTDETEELRKELRKYLEMEGTCKLQTLLCPIKGNSSEAVAIFKNPEDCKILLDDSNNCFFGEALSVVKLPPVFKHINAHLEGLFGNIVKHMGIALEGLYITSGGAGIAGDFDEIMKVTTTLLDNIAEPRQYLVKSPLAKPAVPKDKIDEQGDNQESEKGEAAIEKRAILVSNIPRRLRHSAERIRDILTIHFQRRRNGGGDIDDVLYPVEGCPQNAFIIFTDAQTCFTVFKKKHFLDDFQAEVNVEPFPQVFKTVEAEVDTFYWNFVPRLTSKKLIDHLEQKFGKGNLQTAGHVLKKITCTMDELEEVRSAIAKATGFQSSYVGGHSVINNGVFIKDIPYLIGETEELREELRKYLEMEGACKLQTLLCPIKGNSSEAVAIFQSPEDCKIFLDESNNCFFGESLSVVKLPPVFKHINAHLEELFGNVVKHMGIALEGLYITSGGAGIAGDFEEIMKVTTTLLDNIAEPRQYLVKSPLAKSVASIQSEFVETESTTSATPSASARVSRRKSLRRSAKQKTATKYPNAFRSREGWQINVLQGDLTKQNVDVIVTTSNGNLKHMGSAGVAGAISRATGHLLQRDCDQIMYRRGRRGPLQVGTCIETNGYMLPCKYVVHAVGPMYQGNADQTFVQSLVTTFTNSLSLAESKGAQTVALPLISSGNLGGPKDVCANALATALANFSASMKKNTMEQVFLVNIDQGSTMALITAMAKVFPSA